MTQSKGYVDLQYLATLAQILRETKERSYSLMHLQPGQRVLEVGCGPATDTTHLLIWSALQEKSSVLTRMQT